MQSLASDHTLYNPPCMCLLTDAGPNNELFQNAPQLMGQSRSKRGAGLTFGNICKGRDGRKVLEGCRGGGIGRRGFNYSAVDIVHQSQQGRTPLAAARQQLVGVAGDLHWLPWPCIITGLPLTLCSMMLQYLCVRSPTGLVVQLHLMVPCTVHSAGIRPLVYVQAERLCSLLQHGKFSKNWCMICWPGGGAFITQGVPLGWQATASARAAFNAAHLLMASNSLKG